MLKPVKFESYRSPQEKAHDTGIKRIEYGVRYHLLKVEVGGMSRRCFPYALEPGNYLWVEENFIASSLMETE